MRRVLFSLVVVLVIGCSGRVSTPEQRLLQQFEGSYPREASPNGVVKTFDITAEEAELPLLGGSLLKVWAYNKQVPGPILRIRLGETLRVNFTNRLPQSSTIHWHGVRLPNAMDGVPHLTQPPVEPGGTFIYEFTPKDAGTFWFHPHIRSSEQVERGLYGVLIVEDAEPPPYDRDVVWVLDDWRLGGDQQISPQFNTRHELAHDGRWGNVITVNGRTDTVLRVKAGERIRLRLLNSANGRMFVPDFAATDAKIIAVDGLYLRAPIPMEGFEIAPGNRVDLDITIPEMSGSIEIVDKFSSKKTNHLANIEVEGEVAKRAEFASPAKARIPDWSEGLSVPVAREFLLSVQQGGEYGLQWMINHEAFEGHDHAKVSFTLTQGVWVRLRFVNESSRLHPIHLHGTFFKLLARNDAPVDEPFFRDTVLVHPRETIDIGLVPLDVGRWMMHCHILEHAEAGMMMTFEVE